MSASRRGGVVIGRFMPPHAGHLYLIEFARAFADDLTVFVCTLSSEPIPGDLRFAWMSRLFPDLHLVHITEEIPQASRSSSGAHAIWAEAIRKRLDVAPRYVFASETYGLDLAAELGAEFVPVDPQREVFPISGRMIREHPLEHWEFLPDVVRPYFAKKIVVLETGGTLVRELAQEYGTIFATDYPAYIRSLDLRGGLIAGARDLVRAQAGSEEALLMRTHRVLFVPTDPLWILTSAGVGRDERDAIMDALIEEYPYLVPALIVAVDPVSRAYRDAASSRGWRLVETHGAADPRAEARRRIEGEAAWFGR